MALRCLVLLILVSHTWSTPDADAKSKAGASPSPTPAPAATPEPTPVANPTPKAEPSPVAQPSIFPHHDDPFSVTPIPPFVHPPIYGSLPHFLRTGNKIPYHHSHHSVFTHEIPPGPLDHKLPFHLGPHLGLDALGPLGPLGSLGPLGPHIPPVPYVRKLPKQCEYPKVPLCANNTTRPWCLVDYDYPEYEIEAAIQKHRFGVLALYADVADLSTENSVVRPLALYEETYLCPAEVAYVRPRRAVNTKGRWRTVVNNIKVRYDIFTQTTRLEECLTYGKSCPLVPTCYDSKCIQKSAYQRFLVYDPCHPQFPFIIESFKLPSACSCVVGKFSLHY